ncbi:MAG: hypothetical protein JWR69_3760 [Pedosphaera sp.]|nr:hypothetical protein [Pedosphaera sp.]
MKASDRRQRGKGGIELVEEAIHLLRMAPGAAIAGYYLGSLPFILGLLYFWADMSRSPFAYQHLAEASLGLALLFLWMKWWQALFTNNLRAHLSGQAPPPLSVRRGFRILLIQTALQPTAFIMLPLAVLPSALPFGWFYAFYQNVTALTDGETGEVSAVFKRSYQQSLLWPGQNHIILALLVGFGFCVFINLVSVCFALPQLMKMLFGIESVYTQSPFSLLNTTFFAAIFGLTYLCVDPIIKTVYLLRCFYGESLKSGEDLKADLRQYSASTKGMAAGFILLVCLICGAPLKAAEPAPLPETPETTTTARISPPALDRSIEEVMHRPKYTWRMPREKLAEAPSTTEGPVARFFTMVFKAIKNGLKATIQWLADFFERWFKREAKPTGEKTSFNWIGTLQGFFFVVLAVVVSALAIFLLRAWQQRRRKDEPVASQAILPIPDLADENVGAEELPEDGWIKMGRELLGRGELRLAMRAFYFASLAHLSARNLITIAKFKSNRDYERELRRRGHAVPNLLSLFGENVSVFDRSWYGMHTVDPDMVNQFASNVERIKAV